MENPIQKLFDGATIYAAVSAVLLALGYFTGFCYVWSYYNFYSLSPSELNLSHQLIIVHVFPALWTALKLHVFILIPTIFFAYLALYLTVLAESARWLLSRPSYLVGVLAVAIPLALYLAATSSGEFNARRDLDNLHRTKVQFRSTRPSYPPEFKLQYLGSYESTVFLVARPQTALSFWTIKIPRDEVASIQVYSN